MIIADLDSVSQPLKRCTKCSNEYPATSEFFTPSQGRLQSRCKKCRADLARISREANPQKHLKALRDHYRRVRAELLEAYGGRCCWCGETDASKLQIDHINNDGAEHRNREKGAIKIAYYLKRRGYPSGYQILCSNCNLAKAYLSKFPTRILEEELKRRSEDANTSSPALIIQTCEGGLK